MIQFFVFDILQTQPVYTVSFKTKSFFRCVTVGLTDLPVFWHANWKLIFIEFQASNLEECYHS